MNGTKTPEPSVYGTLGTPAENNMPGNRSSALSWTDSKGNLWLFGGNGSDSLGKYGFLNDLWEYSPVTNQWVWMSGNGILNGSMGAGIYIGAGVSGTLGTPAAGNIPEGRSDAVGWTDAKGNLWLFGGYNYGSSNSYFNDLWEFNPSTNQWEWMSGSKADSCSNCYQPGVYGTLGTAAAGNVPGSRMDAVSWTDNKGNLWLFGGNGVDSNGVLGALNDLWEFNPSTNQWAWMGGSNTIPKCGTADCGQSGVYGTLGTPAAGNIPGARYSASSWIDSEGNFWIWGGLGFDSAGNNGLLNDLWEFNPSTNQWTWVNGTSTYPANCSSSSADACGFAGVYGTLGVSGLGNIPGARQGTVNWTDSKGNLWLFGGNGTDSVGRWGYLDDLWVYSPSTNTWAWMSGSSTVSCPYMYCGQPGVYGALQTPALGNNPSSREHAVSWTDPGDNLWLFGGIGINVVGTWNSFQDLWEFQPNTSGSLPLTATPTFSPDSGATYTTVQTVTINDTTPGATIYYLINGNTPASIYTAPIQISSSETVEAIAGASGYANSAVATVTYTVHTTPTATPTFSPTSGTYTTPQTVTISDATPGATIYYTTDETMPTTSSAVYSGPISVSSSETILAIAVANGSTNSAIASAVYTIGSNSTLGEWAWMGGSTQQNHPGAYGTLRTPAAANIPGARSGSTSWTDQRGNLWLFGGNGIDANGYQANLNDLWEFNPSTHQWAWMGGSNTVPCSTLLGVTNCTSQPGIYGTLATPAAGNIPGGRSGAAGWTDSGGHRWLFGGSGADASGHAGELNDLWEFDPSTLQWTWMGGSTSMVLSYTSYGQPGVYGALGIPAANNVPGGRHGATSWTDSKGNFWLFGGTGKDANGDNVALNDLWEFNPSTKQWAWMSGTDLIYTNAGSQSAVYGTLGVPAEGNTPGSLAGAAGWTDNSGNLWLFGGGNLWKFNPSTNLWAWMSGAGARPCPFDPIIGYNVCTTQPAVYGTLGLPDPRSAPGGGNPAATWTDHNGNFWLFGDVSSDLTGQNGGFYKGGVNTLCVFNPSTNEWAWMGGDYAASNCSVIIFSPIPFIVCDGSQGVLGNQSVPGSANIPPARVGAVSWTDKSGSFWLFSGGVTDISDNTGYVNDL